MSNLYKELVKRERYRQVFSHLRDKVRAEPYRLESAPINKNFSLRWALTAEDEITSFLIKEIKRKKYQPDVCRVAEVELDKKRKLYSFSWPDKIFELMLGRLLGESLEPFLSERVFSFRRGYSNFQAVREFSEFIKQQLSVSQELYVVKRDIADFGDTIDSTLLLGKIKAVLGQQEPYAYQLIDLFLRPYFIDAKAKTKQRLTKGLPTGCSITPVCENFYLTELDAHCSAINDGFYCRYGDDILFVHAVQSVAKDCALQMEQILAGHKLEFRQEKMQNTFFSKNMTSDATKGGFSSATSIDYLGFNINFEGEIFLSSNKLREFKASLRRTAKRAFHANHKNTNCSSEIVAAIIESLNLHFKQQLETPHLALVLYSVTNEKALANLDRWIAKLALRYVYKTGHDKVFRYQSYQSLRKQGLQSLVHLRRLSLRGVL